MVRYDVVQIPSNDPIEDDHVEKIVEVPQTTAAAEEGKARSDWMFWGVFDGHAGWTTSAKLRQTLVSYVARELNATYKTALQDPKVTFPAPDSVLTTRSRRIPSRRCSSRSRKSLLRRSSHPPCPARVLFSVSTIAGQKSFG